MLKGTVMTTEDFFFRAFGEDERQFIEILQMPEQLIMHRGPEPQRRRKRMAGKFRAFTNNEKKSLLTIFARTEKLIP